MATKYELRQLAWSHLRGAKVLLASKEWDRAAYLCGYAVELLLKARICVDHSVSQYPLEKKEFGTSQFKKLWKKEEFYVHDLESLLSKTKLSNHIKSNFLREWSACLQWHSNTRYQLVGTATKNSATQLLDDVTRIVKALANSPGMELQAALANSDNPYAKVYLVAEELMEEFGEFDVFAIVHRSGSYVGSADVVVASSWIDGSPKIAMTTICNALTAKMTPDELTAVAGVIHLDKYHPVMKSLQQLNMDMRYGDIRNIVLNTVAVENATFVRLRVGNID